MLKFYGYAKCDTCRKAKKHLIDSGAKFEDIDITEAPPSKRAFEQILASGDYELGELLNRSGEQYRALNMKERLKTMSKAEVLTLLADNGRLCKRPIVTDGKHFTVGYDAAKFKDTWG